MIKLIKNQKGFTLIELLIAIALTGIISTAAGMSIHQVITGTALSHDLNTAVNQVRNAGYWIEHDVLMAQCVRADDPTTPEVEPVTGELLIAEWIGWGGDAHRVSYTLEDVSGSEFRELLRDFDGQQTLIARYIKPRGAGTDCQWDEEEKVLSVNITVEVSGRTETRTFQVKPRPD